MYCFSVQVVSEESNDFIDLLCDVCRRSLRTLWEMWLRRRPMKICDVKDFYSGRDIVHVYIHWRLYRKYFQKVHHMLDGLN